VDNDDRNVGKSAPNTSVAVNMQFVRCLAGGNHGVAYIHLAWFELV
jgi:hypothetical protein